MASLPNEDPFVELNERAARLGMEPKVFLAWLLDEEKRELLLRLEQGNEDVLAGRVHNAEDVIQELRDRLDKYRDEQRASG